MVTGKKYIRFAMTLDMAKDFAELKAIAENEIAAQLTDAQYAAMLIKWAIKQKKS